MEPISIIAYMIDRLLAQLSLLDAHSPRVAQRLPPQAGKTALALDDGQMHNTVMT